MDRFNSLENSSKRSHLFHNKESFTIKKDSLIFLKDCLFQQNDLFYFSTASFWSSFHCSLAAE